MGAREPMTIRVRLRRDQVNRLELLRTSLKEKMNKEMTISDLLEQIVDEFFEEPRP